MLEDTRVTGVLKTVRVVESSLMKWGPAESLIIFDIIFFASYALGWIITAAFNNRAINDNPITRVFLVYNICIGTDTVPARPICATLFVLAFIFFAASAYLHWIKIYFDGGMNLWVAGVWLTVACLMSLTFSLTFSVPPETPIHFEIHCYAFVIGLLGYILLKAFAITEFFIFCKYNCRNTRQMVYIWSLILFTGFMLFMVFFLFGYLVTRDIPALMAGPVPDTIYQDWAGNILVLLAAVGPPIQYWFVPKELRNTAYIVDATQSQLGDDRKLLPEVYADEVGKPAEAWPTGDPAEATDPV
mmetsp:Transcript_56776/g.157155  ORF Transcript_56776/g.157155 Transcript_56776/m.157155 type:complete len:301 (+) Transcript_56776:74-976(+)